MDNEEKNFNEKSLVTSKRDIGAAVSCELDYSQKRLPSIYERMEEDVSGVLVAALDAYWDFFVNIMKGLKPVIDDHIHGDQWDYDEYHSIPDFLVRSEYGELAGLRVLREANRNSLTVADEMWDSGNRESVQMPKDWELEARVRKEVGKIDVTLSPATSNRVKMLRTSRDLLPAEVLMSALDFYNDRCFDSKHEYSLGYE
jgi:hypothetical protein